MSDFFRPIQLAMKLEGIGLKTLARSSKDTAQDTFSGSMLRLVCPVRIYLTAEEGHDIHMPMMKTDIAAETKCTVMVNLYNNRKNLLLTIEKSYS